MKEEQPARRDEQRGDEPDPRATEAPTESRDQRQARDREGRRDDPQASEPEAEMRHHPGEQEVKRRASPFLGDVLDDPGQGVAADEQRERLVFVGWPGHELVEEEGARRERDPSDAEPHPVTTDAGGDRGRCRARSRFQTRLDPLRHGGFRHPRW